MRQVLEGVTIPTAGLAALQSVSQYLTPLFNAIGFRLNRCLPKDGSEGLTAFTVATRPAAATVPGAIIYVSDGAAGAKFQGSDGSAWVNLG